MNFIEKTIRLIRKRGISGFVRASIRYFDDKTGLISFFLLPYIFYKSRSLRLEDLLEELFGETSVLSILYAPMQVRWEIERLLNVLGELRPRYVLEIGTARGGTLFLWTRVASNDALIISVDLPGGPFGGGYPLLKGLAYKFFARNNQKIVLIRGNSHSEDTLIKVKRLLSGRKLDFLFIDGDHTYEGVKKDFEMYSSLVKKNGIVAFHDIVPHDLRYESHRSVGVHKFWNEIKHKYNYIEIVWNWNQGWAGIGAVYIDD